MELISGLLAAFVLSASAGLNAYIPLLVIGLVARYTDLIQLNSPWDTLTSWWILGLLILLSIVEFFADKIPAVNHANDAVQTLIRPVAGAMVFAASANVIGDIHPVLALAAGLLVAGSVHVVKSAAVRPAITATTGGAANVPVSVAEDALATFISILAVVVPLVLAFIFILIFSLIFWYFWRRYNTNSVKQVTRNLD
jgi:hypothetical protein